MVGGILFFGRVAARPIPMMRPVAFNLTDFGGVGDGVTLNTEAFERAVSAISKFGNKGGGQLNVPPGRWLTAPFNLTSHITLFLAQDSVILAIDVSFPFLFLISSIVVLIGFLLCSCFLVVYALIINIENHNSCGFSLY